MTRLYQRMLLEGLLHCRTKLRFVHNASACPGCCRSAGVVMVAQPEFLFGAGAQALSAVGVAIGIGQASRGVHDAVVCQYGCCWCCWFNRLYNRCITADCLLGPLPPITANAPLPDGRTLCHPSPPLHTPSSGRLLGRRQAVHPCAGQHGASGQHHLCNGWRQHRG